MNKLHGRFVRLLLVLLAGLGMLVFVPSPAPVSAQGLRDLLSLSVDAGYDGRFRPNQWMPLRVQVANQGNPVTGRLVVRPETSGSALTNTFSTPVDLPSNTNQAFFLYITARSNATTLRVELLNENDNVIASRDINVRDMLARDRLYAVVTQATTSPIDLTSLHVGGYDAFQVNWTPAHIPDRAGALDAIDAIILSDMDSGVLTPAQNRAIRTWVTGGGHLIITGGSAWQSTAVGWDDILPFLPNRSETASDLQALAELAGDYRTTLTGDVIVARGEITPGAWVLTENTDGLPLVVRRFLGNGTVDYVTVDPGSQPLRQWNNLPELWFTMISSTDARPGWSYGFANWSRGATAVEILPGHDLLPAVLGLIVFLGIYVGLIGPVNYFLLSRINRREYAWITIPVLILIFSVLAWSVGFELRGNTATLSRLSVIQTWPDSEEARLDQLIGLLAPRRGNYDLSVTDERLLRPISASLTNANVLGNRLQSITDIRQTNRFEAVDFPVDASFIAAFSATGTTPRPAINGRLTLVDDDTFQTLQGSIRNDSSITLHEPVILARGVSLRLNGPLEPGSLLTFNGTELTLPGSGPAFPSPLEYAAGDANPFLGVTGFGLRGSSSSYASEASRSATDILGGDRYVRFNFGVSFNDDLETQETRRRQAFLDSFMVDQFASTARGNRVYLVGWANEAPTLEEVGGADYSTVDTTLYIIELEVERQINPRRGVLITQDQFSWTSRERSGVNDIGPVSMTLYSDTEMVFRFTPLPDAVLSRVDEITLVVQRVRTTWSHDAVALWDWYAEEWEVMSMGTEQRVIITDPARFLGPQNSVQVRTLRDNLGGSIFIDRLGIEQFGRF